MAHALRGAWLPALAGRKCNVVASKFLGFIFFEFFSNLGGTGCRRGRTPERPLRQPFQGLADCQAFCDFSRHPVAYVNIPRCVGCSRCAWRACPVQRQQTWFSSSPSDQISQIGIANCCADKKFRSTVDLGSFPFRYKRAGAERRGKTSGASDVPLRSRVRSPSSAGRHPCRDRPGRSGGGGTIGSLSRQERESPGG
jgi:hypothetical protein